MHKLTILIGTAGLFIIGLLSYRDIQRFTGVAPAKVSGQQLVSLPEVSADACFLRVEYTFTADATNYSSNYLVPASERCTSEPWTTEEVETLLADIKDAHDAVTVHYDPREPSHNVLILPSDSFAVYLMLGALLSCAAYFVQAIWLQPPAPLALTLPGLGGVIGLAGIFQTPSVELRRLWVEGPILTDFQKTIVPVGLMIAVMFVVVRLYQPVYVNWGLTPLQVAARNGLDHAAKRLLDAGAPVDEFDDHGRIALTYAAAEGESSMVRLLLEAGADPKSADNYGKTPIVYAHDAGHKAIADDLAAAARLRPDGKEPPSARQKNRDSLNF